MPGINTVKKLNQNICFCLKKGMDIKILDCDVDCRNFNACSKKWNNDLKARKGVKYGN